MWSVIRERTGGFNFLMGMISNRSGKFKVLGLQGVPPIPSLNETS